MPPALLIIADDLTGANDTGVQFAKCGLETLVVIDPTKPLASFACQVLVVNTESRHCSPEEAFQRVNNVAQQGVQLGIPQFYKKTDSTLRGNLGAELAALLAATKQHELFFAPAYPKLHRTTRGGVQFVNAVPLHQSPFAHDPRNPQREASIAALIAQQTNTKVAPFVASNVTPTEPTIFVVDAETDEDLQQSAHALKDKPLLAGAAGFAEFLPAAMALPSHPVQFPALAPLRLVVNGSLHEASRQQVAHAAQQGWAVIEATPALTAAELIAAVQTQPRVVLTTPAQRSDSKPTLHLAALVAQTLKQISVPNLAIFGGDTLAAIAEACRWQAFRPRAELLPGLPLVEVCGRNGLCLLTKAGGFGTVDWLTLIQG